MDCVIKVGSQFIQIATAKKQEVVPGLRLSATVNDIFRLADVDESNASIQTEDDSGFGLRTEGGKIVMYFTSSKKADILQAIRSAKSKHGKDSKPVRSFDRHVQPQDIPGPLLNIAFTNMASNDEELRHASYDLLCALCKAFNFVIHGNLSSSKGGFPILSICHIPNFAFELHDRFKSNSTVL